MELAPYPIEQLGIGDVVVVDEPKILSTVLGSCVAVCLFSVQGRCAAMNHFALPHAEDLIPQDISPYRYGNHSLAEMLRLLKTMVGSDIKELKAKILGGAVAVGMRHSTRVGEENVALARAFLREQGIPIVGENVGGSRGRRVLFYTNSGRVRMRLLERDAWDALNPRKS